MTSVRLMRPEDLLHMNLCNLDHLTENYDLSFYLNYLMTWPALCIVVEDMGLIVGYSKNSPSSSDFDPAKRLLSQVMGKLEEQPRHMQTSPHYTPWHGHITVLTVAPQYRRMGFARLLCESLERASNQKDAWFVDLYVRASNKIAVEMYKKMGYSVYRRVVGYYNDNPTGEGVGGEDAFDMRKPLDRDTELKWVRENGEDFRVSPDDVY